MKVRERIIRLNGRNILTDWESSQRMCNGCNKIKNKEKAYVTVSRIPPEMKSKDMDSLIHGYGIKNVLSVVEKYQGSMYFEIHDGRWIVDVNLILPTF